jgi:hypothetical protein
MSKVTTKMLKDLLERVLAGDVLITDFSVTNKTEEIPVIDLKGEVRQAKTRFTGDQTYYIEAIEVSKSPEFTAESSFGASEEDRKRRDDFLEREALKTKWINPHGTDRG